jgi:hypothetical protein
MARKRTTLDAILGSEATLGGEAGEPRAEAVVTALPPSSSRRPEVKQQTVYLPLPVYEQLRRLAFEERVKMHQLLMEGLDRVFQARGLAGLRELERPRSN